MKKLFSLALVLAMLLSLSVTAFAAEITGDSGSVEITYTYTNPASYVLTIPDTINLTTEESELGTVSLEITELAEHRQVDVYVSSPNYDDSDYYYPWSLLDESAENNNRVSYSLLMNIDIPVSPFSPIFSGTEAATYSTVLYGNVKEAPAYAGTYKDTLTFTVNILTADTFLTDADSIALTQNEILTNDSLSFSSAKTLDLNGYTLSAVNLKTITAGNSLTIGDSVGGGKVVNITFSANVLEDAKIVVNGGTFENSMLYALNPGVVTVNAGTFTGDIVLRVENKGTATINGGTFNGNVSVNTNGSLTINGGTFSFDPSAYVDTTTHTVTDNSDGTWTVTAN